MKNQFLFPICCMDKLEMALFLIEDAQKQSELLPQYNHDSKTMDDIDKFCNKWKTTPKKSCIKDDIKMARRFLLEASKEL